MPTTIAQRPDGDDRPADRRRPAIPEHRARTGAALQAESRVAVPGARRHRIRHAAGRQPVRPLERSERQQYAAKDAAEPRLRHRASTGRRTTRSNSARPVSTNSSTTSWLRKPRQVGAPNASFTFNAPKSEHRGVELAADWKFYPGWRFTAAYTYLDEVYTEYTENLVNGATFSFNRAGNKIPGISPHELTARLGYDQMWGRLRASGRSSRSSGRTRSTWTTPIC